LQKATQECKMSSLNLGHRTPSVSCFLPRFTGYWRGSDRYMKEQWKEVVGYEGLYLVSSLGRIKSYKRLGNYRTRIKNDRLNRGGYKLIDLCKNSKNKTHTVHRIVAVAFLPNPFNKLTINHKNGIKSDNRLKNLEWATISENLKHAFKTGLKKPTRWMAILTERQVKEIRRLRKNGLTNKELAKKYGVSSSAITNVTTRIRWKHVK